LGDDQEAVEAMQDTFVQVVRHTDRLRVQHPSSLLWRIATNTCLNHLRTRQRRPLTADSVLVARIACAPDAEDRTSASMLLDRIFAREQPSTRVMAVLHLLDGMTLEEVAQETGLSVSGVRKRLRVLKAHVAELEGAY